MQQVFEIVFLSILTLLHPERPKLHTILAFLRAIGLSHLTEKGRRKDTGRIDDTKNI